MSWNKALVERSDESCIYYAISDVLIIRSDCSTSCPRLLIAFSSRNREIHFTLLLYEQVILYLILSDIKISSTHLHMWIVWSYSYAYRVIETYRSFSYPLQNSNGGQESVPTTCGQMLPSKVNLHKWAALLLSTKLCPASRKFLGLRGSADLSPSAWAIHQCDG